LTIAGSGSDAEGATDGSSPIVSIVIPTFNSAKHFRACAKSIKSQAFTRFEVIVVDKCSTDGTQEMARDAGFRVITSDLNRMAARELGIRSARGEYILMIDSDHELPIDCVENVVSDALAVDRDALTIKEQAIGESRWVKILGDLDRVEFELGWGLPRWFRKSVISQYSSVPYSNEIHVAGEDRMIHAWLVRNEYRLGKSSHGLLLHHDPDFLEYLQKQYWYARHGAPGPLLINYVATIATAGLSAANLLLVHRVLRSWKRTVLYACVLLLTGCVQVVGLIGSRTLGDSRRGRSSLPS
jgi:glycosyltransferase involved in cell wall biosynthesis